MSDATGDNRFAIKTFGISRKFEVNVKNKRRSNTAMAY